MRLREVAVLVAHAVVGAGRAEGLTGMSEAALEEAIRGTVYQPAYPAQGGAGPE